MINDSLHVTLDARGAPAAFTWRGERFEVEQVLEDYEIDTDWWSERGRIWRRCVTVAARSGLLCELGHDLLANGWVMLRVGD